MPDYFNSIVGDISGALRAEVKTITDLIDSLDLIYGCDQCGCKIPLAKVVNEQHAKLSVESNDLDREIKEITAKITAKESEFVDIKKNAGNASSLTNLFTQQDYLTMMLYVTYIILGISFYWRMITVDGFSMKSLALFLVGWLAITVMLFNLFSRYV
jgi:hypothetical protein